MRSLKKIWRSALLLLPVALAPFNAHAQKASVPPACRGENILDRVRDSNPDAYAKIQSQASKTKNAGAILWKVERDGTPTSYLFGTIHSSDPRVTELKPVISAAFQESDKLLVEIDGIGGDAAAQAIQKFAKRFLLPADRRLDKLLDKSEFKVLSSEMKKRGVPAKAVARFRPWLMSAMLAHPKCETLRTSQAKIPFLDQKLEQDAKAKGRTVVGLETIEEQLDVLSSQPLDVQIAQLRKTIALVKDIENHFETMTQLYLDRRLNFILPLSAHLMGNDAEALEIMRLLQEKLIDKRNRLMVERALPHMRKGNAFVAVGAAHLFGDTGLVAGFRKAGYTVSAVD